MIVDCALYEDGRRQGGLLDLHEVPTACRRDKGFVWLGLYEPTEDEFTIAREEFGLHELAVEDAIAAHQRPKLEVYDDSLFVVVKTLSVTPNTDDVAIGELLIFVGNHFIVVVRHGEAGALHDVRLGLEERPDLLELGPGAVLHAIVDSIVDGYLPIARELDREVRELELAVFSETDENPVERIYRLKRQVLEVHRSTVPLLDPLDRLATRYLVHIASDTREYFRDVHDHLQRVVDQFESYRDLLTSILEANLTRVSVRQNEDMRKISAWVAIAAVPTAIAGLYGMNFDNMPELSWRYGYPLVILVIGTICSVLYWRFKRSGWL